MSDWDEVFADAILLWGEEAQWRQLQEECGELIAAVNQEQRGSPGSMLALLDEVADAMIMVRQARQMLGADLVDRAIAEKVTRLKLRVERARQGGSGPVGG